MNSFFKRIIIILCIVLTTTIVLLIVSTTDKRGLIIENGQIGFIFKGNLDKATINGKEYNLYKTTDETITLSYESFHLEDEYDDSIQINDKIFKLQSQTNNLKAFSQNEIQMIGLNIQGEELIIDFKSGQNEFDGYDSFQLRNIKLLIGDYEIWSNEYTKIDYENVAISFGGPDLESNYRWGYTNTKTLSFSIPEELLKYTGTLIDNNSETISYLKNESKEVVFENDAYLDFEINLLDNQILDEDFKLSIEELGNISKLETYMDGLLVQNSLNFSSNCWSNGTHYLTVKASNDLGFTKEKQIEFSLSGLDDNNETIDYTLYDPGVSISIDDSIDNLGQEIDNAIGWESPFSKYSVQNYVINDSSSNRDILWKGMAPINRTLYMQLYNHLSMKYDTVSTTIQRESNQEVILGYDYQETSNLYVKDGVVTMRVISQNITTNHNIDQQIFHITDTQYITQKGISTSSFISGEAKTAFNSLSDYIIREQNNNLIYSVMTGDFVQTVSKGEQEWSFIMSELFNPLFNAEIPFGVSSGNHDIGALKENSLDGINASDSDLLYDYYYQNLGRHAFEENGVFQNDFEDNRSHYDLVSINGNDYLFLYLGWGSSFYGLHVSSKDINYAKSVLEANTDKTVILLTHEYMGNKGNRTITGEYIYDTLVKKYNNISFVLSGHINGSSNRIDSLDTDGDNINDRLVFQMLTDFQEEESLYGASYIRRMGFDFLNNQIVLDIYSPFFGDTDIFVINNEDIVDKNKAFVYDFDLNNIGYGLMTTYIG